MADPAPPRPDAVRVLVIADDPLVRTGLGVVLSARPAFVTPVASTAAAGRDELLAAVGIHTPDVVLWDLGPEPSDARAGERLAPLAQLGVPAVVLAPDEAAAAEALAAGAAGVLSRNAEGVALAAALQSAAAGLVVLDPALPSVLPARDRVAPRASEELTARELEVLQLLSLGLANKVIAQRLGISDHTVKFHVNAILTKLGAQSRTEAVVQAARLGLVIL